MQDDGAAVVREDGGRLPRTTVSDNITNIFEAARRQLNEASRTGPPLRSSLAGTVGRVLPFLAEHPSLALAAGGSGARDNGEEPSFSEILKRAKEDLEKLRAPSPWGDARGNRSYMSSSAAQESDWESSRALSARGHARHLGDDLGDQSFSALLEAAKDAHLRAGGRGDRVGRSAQRATLVKMTAHLRPDIANVIQRVVSKCMDERGVDAAGAHSADLPSPDGRRAASRASNASAPTMRVSHLPESSQHAASRVPGSRTHPAGWQRGTRQNTPQSGEWHALRGSDAYLPSNNARRATQTATPPVLYNKSGTPMLWRSFVDGTVFVLTKGARFGTEPLVVPPLPRS